MAPSNYRLIRNYSRNGKPWRVVKGRFYQCDDSLRKKFMVDSVIAEFNEKEEGVAYLKAFKVVGV